MENKTLNMFSRNPYSKLVTPSARMSLRDPGKYDGQLSKGSIAAMTRSHHDDGEYSPEETARRMKRALQRALNMPPQPHGPNPQTPPTPKPKERPASKERVHKGKSRS